VSAPAAPALVARFARQSIVVLGDLMLDHFVVGTVTRISPEAPVPVVAHLGDEHRLGGAANVAHNVCALGGRVALVGVVGQDAAGERLLADLDAAGIDASGVVRDASRPTTRKMRVVTTRHQQVARVDYETDRALDPEVETRVLAEVDRRLAGAGALVISDYLKGVVTERVAAGAIAAARRRGVPVIVDPKVPHVARYGGATLVTPNEHEAEAVTFVRIRSAADAGRAARAFREQARCTSVLITRGEHGMWLLDGSNADPSDYALPAVAREVADVTGAGDTVVGTLALALAAGASLVDAARLANHAAGIVVAKFGPATATPAELVASLERDQ
jgi:rfaE bifunctional protein kinase chain/domain